MSHAAIAADVSYFQKPVNSRYRRQWLIFRACDGTFRDPNFAANYAWACKATKRRWLGLRRPNLKGFTVYGVYRPGVDIVSIIRGMVGGTPHPKMTAMIDVERWNGQISGDHSPEINHRANDFSIWLHSNKRVLIYANQGDYAALFPKRDHWLQLIVAGYSAVQPSLPQMIGWQYTDGSGRWPVPDGLPTSSAPFGRCDHNVFPGLTPDQLADALGVGTPQEDELSQKEVDEIKAAIAAVGAQIDAGFKSLRGEFRADNGRVYRLQTFLEHIPGYRAFAKRTAKHKAAK